MSAPKASSSDPSDQSMKRGENPAETRERVSSRGPTEGSGDFSLSGEMALVDRGAGGQRTKEKNPTLKPQAGAGEGFGLGCLAVTEARFRVGQQRGFHSSGGVSFSSFSLCFSTLLWKKETPVQLHVSFHM